MPTSRQPIIVRHKSDSVNVAQHLHDDYAAEKQLADAIHEIYEEKYNEERGIVTSAKKANKFLTKALPKKDKPSTANEEQQLEDDAEPLTLTSYIEGPSDDVEVSGDADVSDDIFEYDLGESLYTMTAHKSTPNIVTVSMGKYTFLRDVELNAALMKSLRWVGTPKTIMFFGPTGSLIFSQVSQGKACTAINSREEEFPNANFNWMQALSAGQYISDYHKKKIRSGAPEYHALTSIGIDVKRLLNEAEAVADRRKNPDDRHYMYDKDIGQPIVSEYNVEQPVEEPPFVDDKPDDDNDGAIIQGTGFKIVRRDGVNILTHAHGTGMRIIRVKKAPTSWPISNQQKKRLIKIGNGSPSLRTQTMCKHIAVNV